MGGSVSCFCGGGGMLGVDSDGLVVFDGPAGDGSFCAC